jgi:G:T-mismatch repair DNA endonuclease (very short patch repair protein)/tRNA-binding EMAP/Myf-like protein
MSILLEFFDIQYYWKNDIPIIKLVLKDSKKVTNKPLMKTKQQPYSGSQLTYYIHYLGDKNIAEQVYNERKKLFSKTKLIEWYINAFNPVDSDKLYVYINTINNNISTGLQNHYLSEQGIETKKKLKERNLKFSKSTGKIISDRWKNEPDWVIAELNRRKESGQYDIISKKFAERMSNPEYKEWYVSTVIKNPIRIEKIRVKAKQMWADAKTSDIPKYKRMLQTGNCKKFTYNNIKMNGIEYLMADFLDTLNITWEYEHIFQFGNYTYIPDFYLPEYNIIIECYGDFWHGNPNLFKSKDKLFGKILVEDKWIQDDLRKNLFIQNNFVYLFYWESDIHLNFNNIENEIINKIKNKNNE